MVDRVTLVDQMAKAFVGEALVSPPEPTPEARERAEQALVRVELFLGVDVERAKDVLDRVLEDVS